MKRFYFLAGLLFAGGSLLAQSVGIGTTTPNANAMLDINSNTKGILVPRTSTTTRLTIPAVKGLLVYDTTTSSFWFSNGSVWNEMASGGASLWTASGTNIYNNNTGNVGIGTSTPTSKLHVSGSLKLEATGPDLQFSQSGISKVYVQSSGDDLRMGTNSGNSAGKMIIRMDGTNRIYIDSIGQVGIGRSAPAYDLDINGNVRIQTTSPSGKSTLNLYANPYNGFDPYAPPGILFSNYQNLGGGNYDFTTKFRLEMMGGITERLKLYHVDYDNQLVINKNGNVGINESFPTEKLQVDGNILLEDVAPLLKLKSTSMAAAGLEPGIEFNSSTANLARVQYTNGGLAFNASGTSSSQLFLKNGFLGINNTNPQERLDVLGNGIFDGNNPTIQLQQFDVDKGFLQLNGNDIRIGANSSNTTGKFVVRTGGADQVYVDQNGNMGFGVSAPISRLQILTGDDASLSTHGYVMLGSVTGSNLILDNNEIMARSNGAVGNLVLQNDGGTVRIGNVAVPSGYKFAVNGKMLCEELRVKLAANWPDYVFRNDYRLLPLPELKKFIEQNNHLPNIPKAETIEKEGMEVGDMQKKMMEKIEELTLYIIDLQKQVDELKRKEK